MKTVQITLKSIQDIRTFVNEVTLLDYDVDLEQGRYKVDAKSIMGIMAFNPSEGMSVSIVTEGSDEQEALLAIERFLVCE